jgi:hypothetical protein
MMKNYHISLILISFLILVSAGCSSTTKLSQSWKDPDYSQRDYKKIAVVAIVENTAQRRQAEQDMVKAFKYYKIEAISSIPFFKPDDTLLPDNELIKKFTDQGCDGILTVKLFDVKTTQYINSYNSGPTVYGGFGGYYGYGMGMGMGVSVPLNGGGGVSESVNILLESRFYDLKTNKLIWGGITSTVDPNSLAEMTSSYARTITQEMIFDKVFYKGKKKK